MLVVFFMHDLGRLITGRCIWTTCSSGPRSRISRLGEMLGLEYVDLVS